MSQSTFAAAIAKCDQAYADLCKSYFGSDVKLSTEQVQAFNAEFAKIESKRSEAVNSFFASQTKTA
jgi:hypothetical protein